MNNERLKDVYVTYFDRLVPVASAILNGDTEAGRDTVQNVFVELAARKIELNDPERYLMRAVSNRAIDERRRRNRVEELLLSETRQHYIASEQARAAG